MPTPPRPLGVGFGIGLAIGKLVGGYGVSFYHFPPCATEAGKGR